MSDDLFQLCIGLIIFALTIGAIVTIAYFVYQLLELTEQKPKPRAYSRQTAQNPYRNLPLDNQNFSKQKPRNSSVPPQKPKPKAESFPDSIGLEQLKKLRKVKTARPIAVNRRIPHEVLLLLHDDRAAAARLFAHVSSINPGQNEKWCWDKILWDLERDRH